MLLHKLETVPDQFAVLNWQNITTAITMELKVASKARQRMTKRKLRGISAMSSAASSGKPNIQVRGDMLRIAT